MLMCCRLVLIRGFFVMEKEFRLKEGFWFFWNVIMMKVCWGLFRGILVVQVVNLFEFFVLKFLIFRLLIGLVFVFCMISVFVLVVEMFGGNRMVVFRVDFVLFFEFDFIM